jgi:hypothetical protein
LNLAYVADQVVRGLFAGEHFTTDPGGHNAALTDAGIHAIEIATAMVYAAKAQQSPSEATNTNSGIFVGFH